MATPSLPIYTGRGWGKITQTAGTAIVRLITPVFNAVTRLIYLLYTAGSTAHTITVLRPLGKTTVASAAAGGQAVINITNDPGKYSTTYPGGVSNVADDPIAANDYVVYQTADGNYVCDSVSSVSTLAITMSNNVPSSGVLAGAPFWFFGITSDINPADGLAHPQFDTTASAQTTLGGSAGQFPAGFVGSIAHPSFFASGGATAGNNMDGTNEPLIVISNNATAAGTLEMCEAIYSTKPSQGP